MPESIYVRLSKEPFESEEDADVDFDYNGSSRWKESPPTTGKSMLATEASRKVTSSYLPREKDENHNNNNLNLDNFSPPKRLRVERFARLPVWPVWSGVALFVASLFLGKETASHLEHYFGGRVCPMQLNNMEDDSDSSTTFSATGSSPFLLLVHHNHRFAWWDSLFRQLSEQVLPEGFPSHPHRGFTTLTYILQGGFVHRDSMGIRQEYGTSTSNQAGNVFKPAQWLFTGAGMLHEEMFSTKDERQELYQLWINVPASQKLLSPHVRLLSTSTLENDETVDMPVITTTIVVPDPTSTQTPSLSKGMQPQLFITTKSTVRVLAGRYKQYLESTAPIMSDMNILHVTIKTSRNRRTERKAQQQQMDMTQSQQKAGWTYIIPPHYDTLMVYARQGSCHMTTSTTSQDRKGNIETRTETQRVPIHSTVFVENPIAFIGNCKIIKECLTITPIRLGETVDVLVLAAQPLYERFITLNDNDGPQTTSRMYGSTTLQKERVSTTLEPVAMKGSMVMNYDYEIEQAYLDYQMGKMGRPWDHELSDEQWQQHVKRYPNTYFRPATKQNRKDFDN